MPPRKVVLVVGTTPDYVEWIRQSLPQKALFLTDPVFRNKAIEPDPPPEEEVLCDLTDNEGVLKSLEWHLKKYRLILNGITSFDCESIPLAASLAPSLGLSYCSPLSVALCQNKFLSKQKWMKNRIRTPRVATVVNAGQLIEFFQNANRACVLKPQNGTGSELVFLCKTENDCIEYYHFIADRLKNKAGFHASPDSTEKIDKIVVEEFIEGEEFSCDFIVKDKQIQIIRICRKILLKNAPAGTAQAYVLLPEDQEYFSVTVLKKTLYESVKALNISYALCMADMILSDGCFYLLEITPRPGGDCLPSLLKYARNIDILKLTLAVASQKQICLPQTVQENSVVGLRIHAATAGVLDHINTTGILRDPRILQIFLKKDTGHKITLPPEDYDSWVLGHVIFLPNDKCLIEEQCQEIRDKIEIVMS